MAASGLPSTGAKAAYHAVAGSVEIDEVLEVALLTDGVTRLTEWYGYDWPGIFSVLNDEGPRGLIARVRGAEHACPRRTVNSTTTPPWST